MATRSSPSTGSRARCSSSIGPTARIGSPTRLLPTWPSACRPTLSGSAGSSPRRSSFSVDVEPISRDDLLARLRETRLMGYDGARVYEHARLAVEAFDPDALSPAQRYVLMPGVRNILDLRDALDVDIFA